MADTALSKETEKLKDKLEAASVPSDLKTKAEEMIERLSLMAQFQGYSTEYERVSQYLGWITSLPWSKSTEDHLDLIQARQMLDKNHYGMGQVKDRILEYLATMSLTRGQTEINRAPILCLVG